MHIFLLISHSALNLCLSIFHSAENLCMSVAFWGLHVACLFAYFSLRTQLVRVCSMSVAHNLCIFVYYFSLSTQLVHGYSIFEGCTWLMHAFCWFYTQHTTCEFFDRMLLVNFFMLIFLRIQFVHSLLFICCLVHNECICIVSLCRYHLSYYTYYYFTIYSYVR